MEIARNWKDYEILDMADGEKLERWENIILIRPDPQIIWKEKSYPEKWNTGLFPEQAVNWDWMIDKIQASGRKNVKVLNLFAYTGGATVACSYAGAEVCHVDSSKGMVTWAKENIASSGLSNRPVRFIIDDVTKFVRKRNKKRK